MKKAFNRIDMTGKIYNSWKIISEGRLVKKTRYWQAECLECNKVYEVHGPNVRNGLSKRCTNCGHLEGHDKQKGQTRTKRTSFESAIYYLYLKFRKETKHRSKNIQWLLTLDEMKSIIFKKCHYCGSEPNNICQPLKHHGLSQKRTEEATITRNGIDRIDSNKDYTVDNCVPCCTRCNIMKMDMNTNDFITHIKKIIANYNI